MKIQIEKQIEVHTDRNFDGLNAIIAEALQSKSFKEIDTAFQLNRDISPLNFFIYFGSAHVAIHEILPNGEKSERLLFIH